MRTNRQGFFHAVTVLISIFALGSALASAAPADNGNTGTGVASRAYAIGLWGDMPYSDQQALVGVPNLIADMNAQKLAFTVHDGDLKGGKGTPGSVTPTTCADALYEQALGFFNSLDGAAMFTPGDNDWTDCDRAENGSFNSLERLDHERLVFFSSGSSLGTDPIQQEVQTDELCLNANHSLVGCVENRRWVVSGVVYATLNVQGSCNNLCGDAPDSEEWAARNAANIAWLHQTFAEAKSLNAAAVMLISQADPGFSEAPVEDEPLRDPQTLAETDGAPDGFQDFLLALRSETMAFRKLVAYVHGDSHYFRIDRPLRTADNQRVENFLRVETFGDNADFGTNDVMWLKVYVDSRTREVFSFQPQIVPANRTAVPAP